MKTIREILAGLKPARRARAARWCKPVLAMVLGLAAFAATAQPANDNFASATAISGNSGSTSGENTNATLEACETNVVNTIEYGAESITNSVWYTWTATANGYLSLNTLGSDTNLDFVVSVWTSTNAAPAMCDGSLTNIVSDDGFYITPDNDSQVGNLAVTAGTTYYIEVSSYDDGSTPNDNAGSYVLNWSFLANNDFFANATVITGTLGTTNGSNIGATLEPGEPTSIVTDDNNFGAFIAASVWYTWTAPANGNVTFDTIGSSFDTLLAAYTGGGGGVAGLTLLGADDDINLGAGNTNSQVTFYAVKDTTYFIQVSGSTKSTNDEGAVVLNWSEQTPGFSGGQFRFTSTSYTFSQRESIPAQGGTGMSATPGARVTVTRVGGAAGKVNVAYTITNAVIPELLREQISIEEVTNAITDTNYNQLSSTSIFTTNTIIYDSPLGSTNICSVSQLFTMSENVNGVWGPVITNFFPYPMAGTNVILVVTNSNQTISFYLTNDTTTLAFVTNYYPAGIAFDPKNPNNAWDYVAQSGVLTFNDYEMTKDIYVTLGSNNINGNLPVSFPLAQVQVQVVLNSAALDPNELQSIPAPTLDPNRSSTTLNIASMWQDGYGTIQGGFAIDSLCPGIESALATNVIDFERSTLRVNRKAGNARIAVYRSYEGGNVYGGFPDFSQSSTIYYTVDAANAFDDWNTFTLQSGSDYAIPDLATKPVPEGVVDFVSPSWGQVVFPANAGNASRVQYITIPINTNDTVEFNKDIHIMFDADGGHTWQQAVAGQINECWVTILFDNQPAGAVDRTYNVDHSTGTHPANNPNPGANGPVYAVAVQPDGSSVIGGDFTAYNATNALRVVRALPNGQYDVPFIVNTGLGADAAVHAVALDSGGGIFIGGDFGSFNSVQRNGIARLNPDGTLDQAQFLPGYGVNGSVYSIVVQPNGQILIAGNFTTYNNTNRNYIARLNADGSVDPTFDPGVGPVNDIFSPLTEIKSMALQADGRIIIGGDFTSVDGITRNYIARLNTDGSLDTTFDPGAGADDVVNAVAVDSNGLILAGGAFTQLGTQGGSQSIARLNPDGSVDTTFGVGSGADDVVDSIALQPDGGILLGGIFKSINQTRRVSIARLLPDGTLDTSFMDTAYNQFAGLINSYYDPDVNAPNPVYTIAVQPDGNVMIGGIFVQVGGGFSRGDIHPRSNVARLIGGATPGPGNIAMAYSSYSAAGQNTNSTSTITVNRINGNLGPAIATLEPATLPPGPGAAAYGVDFLFSPTSVAYGTTWSGSWMLSDGISGPNYSPTMTILSSTNANTTLNLQLTQPVGSDIFFLGGNNVQTSKGLLSPKYFNQDGENIPLGVALGQSLSPMTIIRNNIHPGVLSFGQTLYVTNSGAVRAFINVIRTGGSDESVTVHYKTVDGTAHAGTDYTATSGILTFGSGTAAGATNQFFSIPITAITTLNPDRYLYVQLYTPGLGAGASILPALGTTNAQLVIINNNISSGNVSFDGGVPLVVGTTNFMTYGTNENQVAAQITVTRQGGSSGQLSAWIASGGGSAVNGVNYLGFTNQLTWNNGISGPQTVYVPLKQDFVTTSNLTVNLRLYGTTLNGSPNALALGGVYTNAILIITNVDQPGTLRFSLSSYSVDDIAGQAIIPVVRTGGSAGTVSATVATFDQTAHSNVNYYGTNTIITFTNGQLSQSIRVPIIPYTAQGPNLAFGLVLTNASPTNGLGSPSVATVTVINTQSQNEPPGSPDPTYNPTAGFDGPVLALALEPSDGKLLVGGSFAHANGVGRQRIARMNTDGSLDSTFLSYLPTQGAGDTVRSIVVQTDGRILVGGLFTNFDGYTFNHFARLNYNGSLDSSFNPGSGADNAVYAMAEGFISGARKLYLGGSFATVNGSASPAVVRLNDNGTVDSSFSIGAGPNGTVFALAVQPDGKVVIGGDFTAVNGVTNCNHIARLNVNGTVDTSFNPGSGADNSVHSLVVQLDGKVLIGGLFNNVNGVSLNHIARLNADGSIDTGFTPGVGANADVQTILLQPDTRIILGGTFTQCSGVTRNYLTRLNPDGTVDPTINFGMGADNFIAASVIQPDGKIIIGGGFLNYDGASHPYLARIFGGSMAGSGAIQFFSANFQVHETATNALITVIRTGGTAGPNVDGTGDIFISYSTSPGTAADPANYTDVSGQLDFPEGETVRTFTVPIQDDGVVTPNLTVNLSITNPTPPAAIGNQPAAVLTIVNDDSTISLSSALYSVPKNVLNGVAPISVVRQGGTNGTSTVTFSTTGGGTATSPLDYTPVSTLVTFPPGLTNVVVNIPINNNGVPEGNRTVTMQLTNASGSALTSPTNATLTIIDNVNAPGQFSFVTNSYVVTEGGGVGTTNVYVTVQRTFGSSGSVSIHFATQDGTAIAGAKYIATNGVLNFADGETSKTFPVYVINTTSAEGPEAFSVYLYNPGNGASLVSPTNTVITILNTNTGIALSSPSYVFTEPAGPVNGTLMLNVVRFNNTNGISTVGYTTTNGTAIAGVNFVGVTNGVVTFNPGDTVKSIAISTIHDPLVTGDLSFSIGLSNPSGGLLTPPTYAVITDHDADAGIRFLTNAASVFRNAGRITIPVFCSNTNAEPVSVTYSTGGGTAIAGTDYTAASGTLSFTNGSPTNSFSISILLNNAVQTNRSFNVTLSSPTPPGVLQSPSVETVTIIGTNTPAGLSFSVPIIISGIWGTTNVNNNPGAPEAGDPSIAGQVPVAPAWFEWTAPPGGDGEVTLDTIGSVSTNGVKLDTVLGVYTGSSLSSLNQVAANDDLYPLFPFTQQNETAQNVFDTNVVVSSNTFTFGGGTFTFYFTNTSGIFNGSLYGYNQPFGGPSGLRFNAKSGTTYYIAVDTKSSTSFVVSNGFIVPVATGQGNVHLTWAYHPSGVFRFASENVDQTGITDTNGNPMLLYQCAESEGGYEELSVQTGEGNYFPGSVIPNLDTHRIIGPTAGNLEAETTLHAYYNYDVNGLLVTVTRVAGSSGRMLVDYTTKDGDPSIINNGDIPAVANGTNVIAFPIGGGVFQNVTNITHDYFPVSGTLVFDDFEMSKTIRIPIVDDMNVPRPNRDFLVVLSNPRRDPSETPAVSPPRIDPIFGKVLCRILDCDIDPKGPTAMQIITTNISVLGTNTFTNNIITDQIGGLLTPTNAIFNFSKANYRVVRDAQSWWNNGSVPITVYVNRSGTNTSSVTVHYRFDNYFLDKNSVEDPNIYFPLQPGSDYATPTPSGAAGIFGTNSDFAGVGGESGTLTFPGGKNNPFQSQPIHFNLQNNHVPSFNKDLHLTIYEEDKNNNPQQDGMVAETTVTILFDDTATPAGSVDELYNPDFASDLALLQTSLDLNTSVPNPGADREVYALALTANNEAIIGGSFYSYADSTNSAHIVHGIARLYPNGELDPRFNGGNAINVSSGDYIRSLALTPPLALNPDGKIVIGGNFTSYNSQGQRYIARLNADGTLDTTFTNLGGFNGMVWSVLVQTDGKVLVGGDFTSYEGTPCSGVVRLNNDGSLDNTFSTGTTITGSVRAMSLPADQTLYFSHASTPGNTNEDDQVLNLGLRTTGVLNVTFTSPDPTAINRMQIYYGGNAAVAAGTGVLLYDSGTAFSGTAIFAVPFPRAGGFTTNVITVVINPGGAANGFSPWNYSISIPGQNNLMIGGQFTVAGQSYANIARLNSDGSLDTSFNPGTGPSGPVLSLAWQEDNKVLLGGTFSSLSGVPVNNLARLNGDGSIDPTFNNGTGADGTVYSLSLQPVSVDAYVGGTFTTMNGTHRAGFARLYSDGTVDTTFLDSSYNQFAGLPRILFNDAPGAVYTSAQQADGNVLIGGSFQEVGGGQADHNVRDLLEAGRGLLPSTADTNLWVSEGGLNLEPKTRDGVRNRSNIARLIGGATPGPGNIGMVSGSYAFNKTGSQVGQEPVTLVRANGSLGYASANFSLLPGLAQSGSDYTYYSLPPLYPIEWEYSGPTRMHSDGLFGANGLMQDIFGRIVGFGVNGPASVNIFVYNDPSSSGNLSAQFQMANPAGADLFYLGGQDIPVGVALGESQAPFTVVDDSHQDGVFSFSSTSYPATNSTVTLTVARTNGNYGVVNMKYQTVTNGSTAVANVDYIPAVGSVPTFNSGDPSQSFPITILNNSSVSSQEKTVNVQLFNLQDSSSGTAQFGQTNTVVRIINPNFSGYLSFSTNAYYGNLSSGMINFTVTRTVGSKGTLQVAYVTANGSAVNGVDYIGSTNAFLGSTNTLTWFNGDVSPRTISIPLINHGLIGPNKLFTANLVSASLNNTNTPALLGSITNAVFAIINDNSYGTFQFSSPSYQFNDNGGYATISVTRSGAALGTASVNYSTFDATAVAGANYVATNNTLTFQPGQLLKTFSVKLLDDGKTNDPAPANFYFGVALSSPTPGSSLGSPTNSLVHLVHGEQYNEPPGSVDPSFNGSLNASVLGLALQSDGRIVAGGAFTVADSTSMNHIVRFNTDGTLDTGFLNGLAGADGTVNAVLNQSDDHIIVGGSFSKVNTVNCQRIARLMTDGSLDTSFNPGSGADNTVFALAEGFVNGNRAIYVGGAFGTFEGVGSAGIVRLNNNGAVDSSFAVGSGSVGTVYAIAVYPTNDVYNAGKVIVGGAFTNFNGAVVGNLVRLNPDGSLDTNFNQHVSINDAVRAIAIQADGGIVIGGDFTNVNSTAANYIARLNADGTLDTAFNTAAAPGINGAVSALAIQQDNRIVVAGQFTLANGVTRNDLTRLLPTGAVDTTINFGSGANGAVNAVVIQPADGKLVIGGAFTLFNGQTAEYIARLFGGSVAGSGAFQFSTGNYVVDENGGFASVTIARTGGTSGPNPDGSGDVFVAFSTTNGTAVAGVNYTATTNYVDFPAGEVLKTVYVPVRDDLVITPNLTVNLLLSNPSSNATIGDQPSAVLTIINDDNLVEFSSPTYSVDKNTVDGVANIPIVRLGSTSGTCTVNFATTTNGTAVIGTDYYPTNQLVTFLPGNATNIVQIPVINNNLPEGNRTVTMIVTNAFNTVIASQSNAVLTIVDTTTNPGNMFFTATNFTADASDGFAYLTVGRTNGTKNSITATYITVQNIGPNSAIPGVNYIPTTNTVTLADGITSGTCKIPLINNTLAQVPVTLTVILANPVTGGLVAPTNTTLTIVNTNPVIAFTQPTNTIPEDQGPASIVVQRFNNIGIVSTVNYFTTSGTAVAGVDFSNTVGTLTFGVGEAFKSISIPLINQSNITDTAFGVSLSSPANAQLVAPSNTVVVLQGSAAGVSFTTNATTVLKNAGSVTITVVCSNPRVEPLLASNPPPLAVTYGTMDGTARAGFDYNSVTGTLIFTNGNGTNTFTVPILNNQTVSASNLVFSVILTNLTGPGRISPYGTQTVAIAESNTGMRFSQATYSVFKTGGAATITVYRTGYTDSVASVDYFVTNGTALAGQNYYPTNGTLVFTNGVTSQSFKVPVIANSQVQPNLFALMELANPTNAQLVNPSLAILNILENGGSYVIPAGAQVVTNYTSHLNDGIIGSNDTVKVLFAFRDSAGLNVTNLVAYLQATNGVTSPSPASQTYGPLTVYGHAVSEPFTFTVHSTNTYTISPTFQLYDGSKFIGPATFSFTVGAWTTTFANSNAIIIYDHAAASPYPSLINVTNVGNTLVKATVTITNLSHQNFSDIDALVVSPGTNTLIMGHVGAGYKGSHITLNFDDAATNSLPQNGTIVSGTNKPTQFYPIPNFP